MRVKEIKLFKFNELSESAQAKAIETYRNNNFDVPWQEEIFQSFKKVFESAEIKLLDYRLSPDFTSYIKIDLDRNDPVYNLSGARALAWLENNLLCKLRITRMEYLKNRLQNFKYGYRIGKIKDCPFTGYCADDDFINCLVESVKNGDCIGEAFKIRMVEKYCELIQAEIDYQNSEEYIIESFEANDYEFLECGTMA